MNKKLFIIKRNDTLPSLQIRIKTRNCMNSIVPFNLSGVTACTFSMVDDCGNLVIASNGASVISEQNGTVQYNWREGDTMNSGRFRGEFELFFTGGKKISVPTLGGIEIFIDQDINNI